MKYKDLSIRAKINCMEQYINNICPYDNGDFDEVASVEDVEYSINEWLSSDQYEIDSDGNWFEDGRKVS